MHSFSGVPPADSAFGVRAGAHGGKEAARGDEEANPKRTKRETTLEDEPEEPNMTKTVHGKVHGKTIELDEDPGVAEGQEVEIECDH